MIRLETITAVRAASGVVAAALSDMQPLVRIEILRARTGFGNDFSDDECNRGCLTRRETAPSRVEIQDGHAALSCVGTLLRFSSLLMLHSRSQPMRDCSVVAAAHSELTLTSDSIRSANLCDKTTIIRSFRNLISSKFS